MADFLRDGSYNTKLNTFSVFRIENLEWKMENYKNEKAKTIINSEFLRQRLFEKTKPICRTLAGNPKLETRNPKQVERIHLKKQSQFASGQIGVNSYLKGYYGNIAACRAPKNKANRRAFEIFFGILLIKSKYERLYI